MLLDTAPFVILNPIGLRLAVRLSDLQSPNDQSVAGPVMYTAHLGPTAKKDCSPYQGNSPVNYKLDTF